MGNKASRPAPAAGAGTVTVDDAMSRINEDPDLRAKIQHVWTSLAGSLKTELPMAMVGLLLGAVAKYPSEDSDAVFAMTKQEAKASLKLARSLSPVAEAGLKVFAVLFDQDGNGKISYNEFLCGAVIVSEKSTFQEKARASFAAIDKDGNGVLERQELEGYMRSVFKLLAPKLKGADLKRVIDERVDGIWSHANLEPGVDGITFDKFEAYIASDPDGSKAWNLAGQDLSGE